MNELWLSTNGTIVNAGTVALGSGIGLMFSKRIPDRYQRIVLDALGLITVMLGIDASVLEFGRLVEKHGGNIQGYGARAAMVVVGSLVVGAVLGTALRLHERLEGLGRRIHKGFGGGSSGEADPQRARFAEGFLSASVIFCIGPLTLLGCLQNGAEHNPSLLYIKSCMDGFCSMALAASLGPGVMFSIVTIVVFQGGLSLGAASAAEGLPELSMQLMNVVGGLILIATALMILEIRKIPVANLLPGILLPPIAVAIAEQVKPGLLLPTLWDIGMR